MDNYGSRIVNSCSFDIGTLGSLDLFTSHFSYSFQPLIDCLELLWTRYYSYHGPNNRFLKFRLLTISLIKCSNISMLHYWHYYCFLKNPEVAWRKHEHTHIRNHGFGYQSFDAYGNDTLWWNWDGHWGEWNGGIKIGSTIGFWTWFLWRKAKWKVK